MPGFRYTAIARGGETITGVMEAEGEARWWPASSARAAFPAHRARCGGASGEGLLTLELGAARHCPSRT
jgi:hypothetical protein